MVEIIPKQRQEYPFFIQILFFGSIALLPAAVGAFFLLLSLEGKTKTALEKVEELLAQGKTAQEVSLETAIFRYRDKFNDFSSFVEDKHDVRPVFAFLERYTHPQVVFTTFTVEPSIQTVQLVGATTTFRTLQEQMAIFQNRQELTGLNLANIVLGEKGQVVFQLEMKFANL